MNSDPKAVKPAVWTRSAVLAPIAPPRRSRGFLRATCCLVLRPSADVARRSATRSFIICRRRMELFDEARLLIRHPRGGKARARALMFFSSSASSLLL